VLHTPKKTVGETPCVAWSKSKVSLYKVRQTNRICSGVIFGILHKKAEIASDAEIGIAEQTFNGITPSASGAPI
jgi:hypothetical protein